MSKHLHLIKNLSYKNKCSTHLHPNILDILFENRNFVRNVYKKINGLYEIHHYGLTVIDPSHKIVSFSTTPNIEYNLINKNLWNFDPIFSCERSMSRMLIWWDEVNSIKFEEIKEIKLTKNGYSLGFTVNQHNNDFILLYSFATKCTDCNLREFYLANKDSLIDLGDYCYKLMRDIYLQYCDIYVPPKISSFISNLNQKKSKDYLKLIMVNNKQK